MANESRISELEGRIETLEAQLDRERHRSGVSRRQALAGILGGTVFGAGAYSVTDREQGSQAKRNQRNPVRAPAGGTGGESGQREANANAGQAAPGEVQSAIDATSSKAGVGIVELVSGEVYDPSSTWELKRGVTLDYNGARVSLSSDIDLVHAHPGTRVLGARNHVRAPTYTSSVFTFDSRFDGEYEPWGNTASVEGGLTTVEERSGTLFDFRSRADRPIYSVRCTGHDGQGVGLIAEFDSGSGSDGDWMNSNRISGAFGGYRRGLYLHGDDRISANEFFGWWQASSNCDEFCVLDGGARENYVVASIWDAKYCENVPIRFGAMTSDNVICSLVAYRDTGGDGTGAVLPIVNNGADTNIVLDMQQINSLLSNYAL